MRCPERRMSRARRAPVVTGRPTDRKEFSSELEYQHDRDDEHVEREGLDERQAEQHRCEDAPLHARLPCRRIDGRRRCPPLSETTQTGGDSETDARRDEAERRVPGSRGGRGRGRLGQRKARDSEYRKTDDRQYTSHECSSSVWFRQWCSAWRLA